MLCDALLFSLSQRMPLKRKTPRGWLGLFLGGACVETFSPAVVWVCREGKGVPRSADIPPRAWLGTRPDPSLPRPCCQQWPVQKRGGNLATVGLSPYLRRVGRHGQQRITKCNIADAWQYTFNGVTNDHWGKSVQQASSDHEGELPTCKRACAVDTKPFSLARRG